MAVPYPPEKIANGQMLNIMEQIVQSLTSPFSSEEMGKGVCKPSKHERILWKGTFEEINRYFYQKGMTDGLPIIPPTEEKVLEMLKGTSHPPEEVVTTEMWPLKGKRQQLFLLFS